MRAFICRKRSDSVGWRKRNCRGGNTVTEAAAIFDRVLANEATRGQEDCVIANAAFAIRTLRPGIALPDAIAEAREALESGRALRAFRKFVELNEK